MLNGLIQSRNTREGKRSTKSTSIKKIAIRTYTSIITLNVNRLTAPTKRHRLAEWIQKQDPYIYAVYKKPTSDLKTHRLKVRGWKNIFQKYTCKCKAKECWSSNLHIRQNRP